MFMEIGKLLANLVPEFSVALEPPVKISALFLILITGRIGYAVLLMFARGQILGHSQPAVIHTFGISSSSEDLRGLKMQLINFVLPLIRVSLDWWDGKEGTNVKEYCQLQSSGYAMEQHVAPN